MELKTVKEVITKGKLVTYDNSNYTVTAYILRLNGKAWQHTLELKDLKANSVRIVPMEKVEVENEKYKITLCGCDDETQFEMELTEKEFELLKKVCELSEKTSTYQCMPIMNIKEWRE